MLLIMAGSSRASRFVTLQCPEGYTMVGEKCYAISHGVHAGTHADLHCNSLNGTAALIESEEEMELLKESFLSVTVYLGMNLRDRKETFEAVMAASGHSGYTNFQAGEPDNYGGEDCVIADRTRNFAWKDIRCSETHPVLCSTQAIHLQNVCDSQSHKFDEETCFWVSPGTDYQPHQAVEICESRGMTLASIHSEEENDFVYGFLSYGAAIGLNDIKTEGDFQWIDGTKLDYERWGSNASNDENHDCAFINRVDTTIELEKWYLTTCDDNGQFICRGSTYFN